jgi:methylmalonyl-CoA mutase N-terminal domain/subunit
MYFAVAQERGIDLKRLSGTTLNDITSALGCVGHMYQLPPRAQMRLVVDLIEWCVQTAPRWHPVAVDSYNYREQEISAVQETGLLLATVIGIIEEEKRRGRVSLTDFVRPISFDMGCHNDFFEEIAKFRATRRMWYKIARERYGTTDPRCWQFRFHAQTSGCTHTTQEPYNNLIRIAYQALACVLGGAQSLHANSFEEGLCLPTELGMLLSVRTEQLLQHETNVVNTVDPLGGSHYVEWLTSELERQAWDYIQKIEDMGGIVAALDSGWIHGEFRKAMLEREKKVTSGETAIVGVNKFRLEEEPYKVPVFRANPKASDIQIEKLRKLKQVRDSAAVSRALQRLRESTTKGENVMPAVMEAVKAEATLGEICDVWRDIYGVWRYPMSA